MSKFNLSLDDFSPHPEAGFNFESIDWCDRLIDEFPDIKINLFVPACYARLNQPSYHLAHYPDWVKRVKSLPKHNYEINPHGLFHRRSPVDFKFHRKAPSNNDEFQFLNEQQAKIIIDRMLNVFDNVGLDYKKVFRPPGWKISTPASQILTDRGFVIAGNQHYYDIFKDKISGLKWATVNWHLEPLEEVTMYTPRYNPPSDGLDIVAAGHTSNWVHNYMNREKYQIIREFLDQDEYEFRFLSQWFDK